MENVHGNVLVVEDDADCGGMIAEVLDHEGFSVHLVNNRNEAASALQHSLYEYIVLDVFMHGMPIEEFLKLAGAQRPNTIIISAVVDAKAVAKKLGASAWLRKPFDHEQLLGAIRAAG